MDMDRFDIWGLICIVVGCGFLVSALGIYLARRKFLCNGADCRRHGGRGPDPRHRAEHGQRGPGGQVQRTESWMGSGFQRFEAGQAVQVRFDPSNPVRPEVDTFAVLWGLALLRAGYGLLFLEQCFE
jgi:hypothetical protein